jgi:acetate kinase
MARAFLVLNAGSSSLKFAVFADEDPPRRVDGGRLEGLERGGHTAAVEQVLDRALEGHRVAAVGHRIVHGGTRYAKPVLVDASTLAYLDQLVPLAPLHQPHGLAAVRVVTERAPSMPQIACFDTAFHRTQPWVAETFALPRRYRDEGVRRYGFHGLSYEFIASALERVDRRAAHGRAVVLHLGNGASMCALREGRSVATTMSFTPLDGLMMGTRSGALDPGVVLYLMQAHGMNAQALSHLLYDASGLLGVSGVSSDMRELLARANDHASSEAIELFVYRIDRELGSLAAALGGLDAVVFTGGIGENAAPIRERVCRHAAWLGVELDRNANDRGGPCISQASSHVSAWVLPTDEEAMIARQVQRVLTA